MTTIEAMPIVRPETSPIVRALTAEFVGSALLSTIVIGSGIAAQQLSAGQLGLQLLENSLVTAMGLGVLILIFGPISGAHFNPVVSLAEGVFRIRPWRVIGLYIVAQIIGCSTGAVLSNLMFGLDAVSISATRRGSAGHWLAEVIATAGLLLTIFALSRTGRSAMVAPAVGCYIGAAYWFTSSTSFANPAITIGRMFSDTFAGISPVSVPGYVITQLAGCVLAVVAIKAWYPLRVEPAGAK